MQILENPARPKAAITYNAAADHFDRAPLAFWDRHGSQAVDLLGLRSGDRVLDVGCGTGASALPAAAAVAPGGHVTGIDLAEKMLARAEAKARARGLANMTFLQADMTATGFPSESFDAVISVFSVFFVPETEAQVAALWRMLRPGGRLAVTVWGRLAFEPFVSVFGEALRRIRPDLSVSGRPWERFTSPESLRRLLLDGGAAEPEIRSAPDRQPVLSPADWWTIALGSGFRWEIDQLTADQQKELRAATLRALSSLGAEAMETGALHAVAQKPL